LEQIPVDRIVAGVWRLRRCLRLPGSCANRMEAAARLAVIGTVLARHARLLLRCVGGKGQRAAAVEEVTGT